MYEEYVKLAREGFKPFLKQAENNTDLAVKLLRTHTDNAVELIEGHLAHYKALAATHDLNAIVEMNMQYVEALRDKMVAVAREDAVTYEAAYTEASKIFEGSLAEAQVQAKKAAENIEKEFSKVVNKAA